MLHGRIADATRVLGAPKDWTPEQGHCGELPVRDEVIDGSPYMTSVWFPNVAELLLLQAGAPVVLRIRGASHPVVSVGVGKAPE